MADITFGPIVKGVVGIVLVVASIAIVISLFNPLAGQIFGFFKDVLNFDPIPFTGDREEITTATASVHALLWSINKVAWYDTYQNKRGDEALFERIASERKVFMGTTAGPILDFGEEIPLSSGSEVEQLVIGTIDCWKILQAGEKNSACFIYDFSGSSAEITVQQFHDFGAKYHKDHNCDKECQEISKNVFGGGLFNWANYDFHVTGGKISKQNPIVVCADLAGFLGRDKVQITDSETLAYERCEPPRGGGKYSVKVYNFELPQQISTPTSTGGTIGNIVEWAEKWVNTYGDPEYVLYYEVFPKGEEAYWEPSAYVVDVATILTSEAVFFFLFDMLIPGLGSAIKKGGGGILKSTLSNIGENLGKAIKQIDIGGIWHNTKTLSTTVRNILRGSSNEAAERLAREIIEKSSQDVVEETVEEVLEEFAEQGISREVRSALKTEFRELWQESEGREVSALFKESGELEERAITRLRGSLDELEELDDAAKNEIMDTVSARLTKDSFESASARAIGNLRLANKVNSELLDRAAVWRDAYLPGGDRAKIIGEIQGMADKAAYFKDLDSLTVRRMTSNMDDILELATTGQTKESFARGILGETYDEVAKGGDEAVEKALNEQISTWLKEADPLQYTAGKLNAYLRTQAGKPRHMVSLLIALNVHLENSMAEKFRPVGTNAVGLRTPFLATTIYDDLYTETFDYTKDKNMYEQFFEHYYGYEDDTNETDETYLRYRGLLPEVERYFLTLLTDAGEMKRFHLASPCKADIIVTETTCECWGGERKEKEVGIPILSGLLSHGALYQTGKTYYVDGEPLRLDHFDGENPMLYAVQEGQIVKECTPRGVQNVFEDIGELGEYLPWAQPTYTPSCIQATVVMDETEGYNYCYHGEQDLGMTLSYLGLNFALPIAGTLFLGPIGGVVGGVVGGLGYASMQVNHQWPNHN
ncbi:TPA: hypothetical protein HA239_04075 [Candidatus Woesearchaeota archaeon]|nr:hypothetical protein QT06_C0001G0768 [archaeon GW2011_AR15]MBS3103452.1 hypothetical protein [Candidatus Woesearchaeota archaeon]HIH41570.1 hypothetical protein [Candidatus Woesearchaeota archaeon]